MRNKILAVLLPVSLVFCADFPVTLTDDAGLAAVIPAVPGRIISMAPSNTEILFALGLEGKVAGVSSFCDFPAAAKKKEKIGDFMAPNLEKILFLKPDLVLAGGGVQKDLAIKLSALNIPTLTFYPKNINELLKDITQIGRATGKETVALLYIEKLKARIEKVKTAAARSNKKPKVYFEIWNQPFTTAGKGSFVQELITLAGGINIFSETDKTFPEISGEEIIKRDPDIIITAYMEKKGKMKQEIAGRSGWGSISAVKEGRIYDDLDPDILLRAGPRLIDGLEALSKKLLQEK